MAHPLVSRDVPRAWLSVKFWDRPDRATPYLLLAPSGIMIASHRDLSDGARILLRSH